MFCKKWYLSVSKRYVQIIYTVSCVEHKKRHDIKKVMVTCSTVHSFLITGKLVFKQTNGNNFTPRFYSEWKKKTGIKWKRGATGTELSDKNKELCNVSESVDVSLLSTGLCWESTVKFLTITLMLDSWSVKIRWFGFILLPSIQHTWRKHNLGNR